MNIDRLLAQWAQRQRERQDLPLRVRTWNGRDVNLGAEARLTVTLNGPGALRHLVGMNLGGLAAAYIEGDLDLEGSVWDAMALASQMTADAPPSRPRWRLPRAHSRRVDAEAIRYHYDVSNDFYGLWLDRNMVYSCGYFRTGHEDIHQAQEQKLDHICRKLMLKPGDRLLDIGCGWGGLIRWATKNYGVRATGITLSRNQHEYARERIASEGLADRCEVLFCDYRDLPGEGVYDKIASVGMFEHVGLKNLPVYFGTARRLLKEGGLMLNHGITNPESVRSAKGLDAGDFIDRYVFPHGELPSISRTVQEMGREDLEVADVECLRSHYAQTLMHWVMRLEANAERARAIAGEKRYRIWRLYMAACAQNFAQGGVTIHQVLSSKQTGHGLSSLPWTRAHLYHAEAPRDPAQLRDPESLRVPAQQSGGL
ncbi:MAG TPA: cyclopropane-fatty-acyl-phospholipid synthase family protein [Oscillatoriaceae cyanobacterium]